MTFEVKYRNAKGEIDYISIDAEDRAKLFEELRNLKISAVQVTVQEGNGNRSKSRKAFAGGAPISGKVKGLAALAVVCVIGAAVFMCVSNEESKLTVEKPTPPKQHRQMPEAIPNTPTAEPVKAPLPVEPKIDVSKLSPAWRKYYDGRDTNEWKVVYNPLTKQEYISRIVNTGLKNAPPPLYKSHALNVLDAIVFKPIASPMANVRVDKRFMKSFQDGLQESIDINPDDSDDIKARKQGMKELILELKGQIRDGGDVQKLIADSLAERNRVAAFKQMMKTERANMARNGASQEELDAFAEICNKKLEEEGATPIVTRKILSERLRRKFEQGN